MHSYYFFLLDDIFYCTFLSREIRFRSYFEHSVSKDKISKPNKCIADTKLCCTHLWKHRHSSSHLRNTPQSEVWLIFTMVRNCKFRLNLGCFRCLSIVATDLFPTVIVLHDVIYCGFHWILSVVIHLLGYSNDDSNQIPQYTIVSSAKHHIKYHIVQIAKK